MAVTTSAGVPVHQIDESTYVRMVAGGLLEGEPVELLQGIIADMSPQSPEHAAIAETAAKYLAGGGGRVRTHSPFEIPAANSVPEPDVLLTDEPESREHHPRTALVIVEVAVSSQDVDRGVKQELYAVAGVPVYWIVNVAGRVVEVRTRPSDGRYLDCALYHTGEVLPAPAAGLADLPVSVLLGS